MNPPKLLQGFASLLVIAGVIVQTDGAHAEELRATPYRPTVSSPADLPAPGFLEVEFGGARTRDRSDQTRTTSLPTLFKFAINEDVGVLLGGDAHIAQRDANGTTLRGAGDSIAALKLRREVTSKSAVGVELGARFATARTGLGQPGTDYTGTGVYSVEFGDYNIDLNVGGTHVGRINPGEGRYRINGALALGAPIAGPFRLAVEVSGAARRGTTGSGQALAAVTWEVHRKLILDVGFARGLDRSKAETVFVGLTWLIAPK